MPGLTATAPPFPDDVPVCSLPVIDYELLKRWDRQEVYNLWVAATELGFW